MNEGTIRLVDIVVTVGQLFLVKLYVDSRAELESRYREGIAYGP